MREYYFHGTKKGPLNYELTPKHLESSRRQEDKSPFCQALVGKRKYGYCYRMQVQRNVYGTQVTHWVPLNISCPALTMNGHMQKKYSLRQV